ncbi:MAG: hypothetical protein JO129_00075 [Candidatus Dependentiae bacterium]|nr:hypothetical protein [Candidatus Dependentiae bacterium]
MKNLKIIRLMIFLVTSSTFLIGMMHEVATETTGPKTKNFTEIRPYYSSQPEMPMEKQAQIATQAKNVKLPTGYNPHYDYDNLPEPSIFLDQSQNKILPTNQEAPTPNEIPNIWTKIKQSLTGTSNQKNASDRGINYQNKNAAGIIIVPNHLNMYEKNNLKNIVDHRINGTGKVIEYANNGESATITYKNNEVTSINGHIPAGWDLNTYKQYAKTNKNFTPRSNLPSKIDNENSPGIELTTIKDNKTRRAEDQANLDLNASQQSIETNKNSATWSNLPPETVNSLFSQLQSLRNSAAEKLKFATNTISTMMRFNKIDPTVAPDAATRTSVTQMAKDFANNITPTMSLSDFRALLNRISENIGKLFTKKTTVNLTEPMTDENGNWIVSPQQREQIINATVKPLAQSTYSEF